MMSSGNTDKDLVKMKWTLLGYQAGQDPIALFAKKPGKIPSGI